MNMVITIIGASLLVLGFYWIFGADVGFSRNVFWGAITATLGLTILAFIITRMERQARAERNKEKR